MFSKRWRHTQRLIILSVKMQISRMISQAVGISTPEQAKKMANISDGAIVGSAIIKLLEQYGKDAPKYIGEYVKKMKMALLTK